MPKDELSIEEIGQLVRDTHTAFEEFKSSTDEMLAKKADNQAVDVLIEEKIERINKDLNELSAKNEQLVSRLNASSMELTGDDAELEKKTERWIGDLYRRRGVQPPADFGVKEMREYDQAFERYLRVDNEGLAGNVEETKALSVGKDPEGGYLVSPDMSGRIVTRQYETSNMRGEAAQTTISTDALEGLTDLNEVSFGWVSESGGRPTTDTADLGRYRIEVHEMYAMPAATQKILDDAVLDLEAWLAEKVADRFARAENAAFVNGNGVGRPRGFLTYDNWASAGVVEDGKIEQLLTGVGGGFATATGSVLPSDSLVDLIYSVKDRYRARGKFYMSRLTQGEVRKLKDGDGNYIWQPNFTAGQPATVMGYPVVSFEDMPDSTTTGALAIAYGDMSEAYQIVDRHGVQVLRDPYSSKPNVLFYSRKRVGGAVIDFEALKLLKFATS